MFEKIHILDGGYCVQKEKFVIKNGRNINVKFPSMFSVMIHEKHGVILFDTGYSEEMYNASNKFPLNIYTKLIPVFCNKEDTAIEKLRKLGIDKEEVKYIIISHFHADHMAGIKDFPKAKYIYMKNGYDNVKELKGFKALKHGFLKELLPNDFESRSIQLDLKDNSLIIREMKFFNMYIDFFGDNSLKLISMEGHYRGHLGALCSDKDNQEYLFIADSCWLSKSYKEKIFPSNITMLLMDNTYDYISNLEKINMFYKENKNVNIIPSHCNEVYDKFVLKENNLCMKN